ncbi:MAG: hypothetical protein OIF51_07325, partial [Cellvibrionaceae bacterium]|nr:hypothetical protein [Cellvibrionaceae bacterium]
MLHDQEAGDEEFTDSYSHYGYYTGFDFLELGRRLGLQEKPIQTFITKLKTSQKTIIDLINRSYMPEAMKSRAVEMVESRIRAIQI